MDFTSLAMQVMKNEEYMPRYLYFDFVEDRRQIYDPKKEKAQFREETITYDKIRWSIHRENVMKRKNIFYLPHLAKAVQKLIGLHNLPAHLQASKNSAAPSKPLEFRQYEEF